jgi:trk system potassium uptake protein TrkA
MHVIIFGCGRTGAELARTLTQRGHRVTVIERDPLMLERLGEDHKCRTIVGNGLDEDVLRSAGIETADAFVSTTRGDNTNLMAAQIAQLKYKVPRVCVKVNDPVRAKEYRKLGLFCITPNLLTAGMMLSWLLDEPFLTADAYNNVDVEEGGGA